MADSLGIILNVNVQKGINQAREELNTFIKEFSNKEIKINVNSDSLKNINTQMQSLNNSLNGLGSRSGDFSKITQVFDSNGNIIKNITTANTKLGETVKTVESLNQKTGKWKTQFTQVTDATAVDKLNSKFSTLSNKLNEMGSSAENNIIFKKNPEILNTFTALNKDVETFKSKLNSGTANLKDFNELNSRFKDLQSNINVASNKMSGFTSTLLSNAKAFLQWYLIGNQIGSIFRTIREGIQSVEDLDSSMLELKKVTDETNDTYNNFYIQANSVAKQIAVTTQEIIDATTQWAQMGFAMQDAESLAKKSAIFSNISENLSTEDAAKTMITTMKAFNIQASDTEQILDKVNIVGNNFAVTNDDIAEGLKRSASSMSEANNTLDQTIALLESGTEITQDASAMGTALKTVSMRIRGMSEETGEANSELDDLGDTVKSISGVSIFTDDTQTQYKSTYEILKEISKVWDSLDDRAHANLLEKIAGKRQGNRVAAILQNFTSAEEALKDESESSGSAMEEQSKRMDSISAKINTYKETMVGFWQKLLDTSAFKNFIDLNTKLINILDTLLNSFDGSGAKLLVAVTTMSLFTAAIKSNTIQTIANKVANQGLSGVLANAINSFSKFLTLKKESTAVTKAETTATMANRVAQEAVGTEAEQLAAEEAALAQARLRATVATETETTATVGLGTAMKNLALAAKTNPVVWITGAVLLYQGLKWISDQVTVSLEEQQTAMNDAISSYDEAKTSVEELESKLKDINSQIDELNDKDNLSLTDQEQLNLLKDESSELRTQLALEKEVEKEKAKKAATEASKTFTKNSAQQVEANGNVKYNAIGNLTTDEDQDKYIDEQLKDFEKLPSQISEAKAKLDEYIEAGDKSSKGYKDAKENLKALRKQYDNSEPELTKLINSYKTSVDAMNTAKKAGVKLTSEQKAQISQYNAWSKALISVTNPLEVVTEKQEAFNKLWKSNSFKNAKKDLLELADDNKLTGKQLDKLAEKYPKLKKYMDSESISADQLSEYINSLNDSMDDASDSTNKLATASNKDIVSSLSDAEEGLKLLNSAMEDFQDEGKVSFSTLSDIADKFSDVDGIDGYIDKLSKTDLTADELSGTLTELTNKYINSKLSVEQLANSSVGLVSQMLSEIGVDNSTAVATDLITQAKLKLAIQNDSTGSTIATIIGNFQTEAQQCGLTETALFNLIAREITFNNTDLDVSQKIQALAQLASQVDLTGTKMANFLSTTNYEQHIAGLERKGLSREDAEKDYLENFSSLLKSQTNNIDYSKYYATPVKYVGSTSSSKKSGSSGKKSSSSPSSSSTSKSTGKSEIDKLADSFQDKLDTVERELDILSEKTGTEQQQLKLYVQLQKQVNAQANIYRSKGLSEDSKYIQELKKKWFEYRDDIISIYKDIYENKKDSIEQKIFLLSKQDNTESQQIALYKNEQDLVHQQANKLRALGYSDDSDEIRELQKEWWSLYDEIQDIVQDLSDETKDLYSDQLDDLNDVRDLTKEIIDQETNDQIDALNDQIDAYEKIVELKKKSLEQDKDSSDYQDDIAEQTKDIADLQSQITLLSLDDSREAAAQKAELEEQLTEKQKTLSDTQSNYSYNQTTQALDDEADAYEDSKDKEIDTLKDFLDDEVALNAKADDLIENNWDELQPKLISYYESQGNTITSEIIDKWNNAISAVQKYGSVTSALTNLDSVVNGDETTSSTNTNAVSALVKEMKVNSEAWSSSSASDRAKLVSANKSNAKEISSLLGRQVVLGSDGVWYLDKVGGEQLYSVYHSGGVVGDQPTIKQNEELSLLEDGELVLTSGMQDNLYSFLKLMSTNISTSKNDLFSSLGSLLTDTASSSQYINNTSNNDNGFTFNPTFNVTISGDVSDTNTANEYANTITNKVINTLNEAFQKSGLSNSKLSRLKV